MRCSLLPGRRYTTLRGFAGESASACSRWCFRGRAIRSSLCRGLKRGGCGRNYNSRRKSACGRRTRVRRKSRRRRGAAPGFECVSADAVTIACRGRKSAHELELMRLACEATCDVFRAVFASLKEGMSQEDIGKLVEGGFSKMSLHGGALVLLGASAALPHGTIKPQKLKDGDVVLIDGGCAVDGYQSDVTRTGIFGKAPEKVARVYEIVRKAQDAALDAARAGRLSGTVDDV